MSGKTKIEWADARKVIASNGYVLVRVGRQHHLADCRGYAYEHRLIAERKIGRRLRKGEIAHHINGNKQDNRDENIDVVKSIAHHCFEHRRVRRDAKHPDSPNPVIECACGCGTIFKKYDQCNRARRFVTGHNMGAQANG